MCNNIINPTQTHKHKEPTGGPSGSAEPHDMYCFNKRTACVHLLVFAAPLPLRLCAAAETSHMIQPIGRQRDTLAVSSDVPAAAARSVGDASRAVTSAAVPPPRVRPPSTRAPASGDNETFSNLEVVCTDVRMLHEPQTQTDRVLRRRVAPVTTCVRPPAAVKRVSAQQINLPAIGVRAPAS